MQDNHVFILYIHTATQLPGKSAGMQALVQGNTAKLATKIIHGNYYNTVSYVTWFRKTCIVYTSNFAHLKIEASKDDIRIVILQSLQVS